MTSAGGPSKVPLPLHPQDSPTQTFGCRTTPHTCRRNGLPVCALVRPDGLCLAPPTTWGKRYAELLAKLDERG